MVGFIALAHGAFLAPLKDAEPLTFEIAKDRKERELQVVQADRQIEALEDRRYQSRLGGELSDFT